MDESRESRPQRGSGRPRASVVASSVDEREETYRRSQQEECAAEGGDSPVVCDRKDGEDLLWKLDLLLDFVQAI